MHCLSLPLKHRSQQKCCLFSSSAEMFQILIDKQCRPRLEQPDLGPGRLPPPPPPHTHAHSKYVNNVRKSYAADDFSRRHLRLQFCWRFKGYTGSEIQITKRVKVETEQICSLHFIRLTPRVSRASD